MLRRFIALGLSGCAALVGLRGLQAERLLGQDRGASPANRTGLVMGRVVDAGSGLPIAGALVSLLAPADQETAGTAAQAPAPPPSILRVTTNAEGQFLFHGLAAGRLQLSAVMPGYLGASPGQRRPRGPSALLVLAEGEHLTQVVIRMWKLAVVTGRVVDEDGEPLVDIPVQALAREAPDGRPRLTSSATARTDDRGQFRLSLFPGAFHLVSASTQMTMPVSVASVLQEMSDKGDTQRGQALTRRLAASGVGLPGTGGLLVGDHVLQGGQFVPGPALPPGFEDRPAVYESRFVPALDRDPIRLESGEVRANVELVMRLVPAVRVSGTLTGPDGPVPYLGVQLISRALTGAVSRGLETAKTVADANGAFTFLGVPSGDYTLTVTYIPRPAPQQMTSTTVSGDTLFARQDLAVGAEDVTDIAVPVRRGTSVSGTVVFAGAGEPPARETFGRFRIFLQPVSGALDGVQTPASVETTGAFKTMGFPAGRYFVTATAPSSAWTLASATIGGRDVSVHPLELDSADVSNMVVTFSNRKTTVTGMVRDGVSGAVESEVIVVPADTREWLAEGMNPRLVRAARLSPNGVYEISDLHPGEYRVAAVVDATLDLSIPDVLEAVARQGSALSLQAGQRVVLDLRTIRIVRPPGIPAPSRARVDTLSPPVMTPPPADGVDDLDAGEPHGPRVIALLDEGRDQRQTVPPPQARDVMVRPPPGTGMIAGVVVADDDQGRPVRRAVVELASAMLRPTRATTTNDQGAFVFAGLPAGRFTLRARKPTFIDAAYGATRPGRSGTAIALTEGQQMTGLTIRMTRGAVLEGTLRDEFGRPSPGVVVTALQRRTTDGLLQYVRGGGSSPATTDDRGMYRIWGLRPGDYVVGATTGRPASHRVSGEDTRWALDVINPLTPRQAPPDPGPDIGSAPVYYPGVTQAANAQRLTLRAGDELTGLDFAVAPVPIVSLRGRVVGLGGSSSRAQLVVVPEGALQIPFLTRPLFGATQPDGSFSFQGLAPGRYTVMANAPSGPGTGTRDLLVRHEFEVAGQDIEGLVLMLAEGLHVRGRVVFEGSAAEAPEDFTSVSVRLVPILPTRVNEENAGRAGNPDGAFDIGGLLPDDYRLVVSVPGRTANMPTWSVKSVTVGGRDVTDLPLAVQAGMDVSDVTVTMTDRRTLVTGHLRDSAGRPAPEYSIVVFPVEPAQWLTWARRRPVSTRPDSSGAFRVVLPPGTYYMVALTAFEEDELYDTDFLESLIPAALKITLAEGEEKIQDLQLVGGGR